MKKIFPTSLAISIILGLLFPSFNGFFAVAKINLSAQENSKLIQEQPVVKIVATQVSQPQVVVIHNLQSNEACKTLQSEASNLVQDTGAINLNQPANCFSLQIQRPVVSKINLEVQPLVINAPKIIVVNSSPTISSPRLAGSQNSAQNIPTLPLVFALAAAFVFWQKKIIRHTASKLTNQNLKFSFSIVQLQVFRC